MSSVRKRAANTTASQRLKQDYSRLLKDPVPYIVAVPKMDNILEWHYVVAGPENSPYEGGYYHGKLVFPHDYPFKPPSIYIITPNGRFKCNTRLCLSISDFHPDTWNPAWSVSTILTGLLSFMLEDQPTLGSITTTTEAKRCYAYQSLAYNVANRTFCDLFPDLMQELKDELKERENAAGDASNPMNANSMSQRQGGDNSAVMNHLVLFGAIAALAYFAHTVIKHTQEFGGS